MYKKVETQAPPLFKELLKKISGEYAYDEETLEKMSVDNSPFKVKPDLIIYPLTKEDIRQTILFAKEYSIPLTPRGLGQGNRGACLSEGIILDMSRHFNKMENPEVIHGKIKIEAGVDFQLCKHELSIWGYKLPFVNGTQQPMTIGGMIAGGYHAGPSLFYGDMKNWIDSISIILDDGKEYTLNKETEPTGRLLEIYKELLDLQRKEKLLVTSPTPTQEHYSMSIHHVSSKILLESIIGSQGTFGIITEVTLKVSARKTARRGIAFRVPSLDKLLPIRKKILETKPISLFGFDRNAINHTYEKGTVSSYLIKHFDDSFTLFAVYEDISEEVNKKRVEDIYNTINLEEKNKHIIKGNLLSYYENIFYNHTPTTNHPHKKSSFALSLFDDTIIPAENQVSFIQDISTLCRKYNLSYSITGDFGNTILYPTPLTKKGEIIPKEAILNLLVEGYELIAKHKGTIHVKAGVGITNTPFIKLVHGEKILTNMKAMKSIFDPNNIFNPGKKTTIDLTYVSNHLKTHV